MTSMDKAAIVWSIAIVAAGAGFAAVGLSFEDTPTQIVSDEGERPSGVDQQGSFMVGGITQQAQDTQSEIERISLQIESSLETVASLSEKLSELTTQMDSQVDEGTMTQQALPFKGQLMGTDKKFSMSAPKIMERKVVDFISQRFDMKSFGLVDAVGTGTGGVSSGNIYKSVVPLYRDTSIGDKGIGTGSTITYSAVSVTAEVTSMRHFYGGQNADGPIIGTETCTTTTSTETNGDVENSSSSTSCGCHGDCSATWQYE